MRIWYPKKNLLRSVAKTAAEVLYPDLGCGRPVTKFPSKLLVPQPLGMQSLGFPCCCYNEGEDYGNCFVCNNSISPASMHVRFSGLAEGSFGPGFDCYHCCLLNDKTFVLAAQPDWGGPLGCEYAGTFEDVHPCGGGLPPYTIATGACGYNYIKLQLFATFMRVTLMRSGISGCSVSWKKEYEGSQPCLEFSDEELTLESPSTRCCDASASTCYVTSYPHDTSTETNSESNEAYFVCSPCRTTPMEIAMTIEGTGDDQYCENIDGTYICCYWGWWTTSYFWLLPGPPKFSVYIGQDGAGAGIIRAYEGYYSHAAYNRHWMSPCPIPVSCSALSDYDLGPMLINHGCVDPTGATCKITAL